jgi:hypothetical protein
VRETCFDIQATAAILSAVDTGFQKNSIFVLTGGPDGEDTRNAARTAGGSAAPDRELLDEVEQPEDPLTGRVVVGARYGLFNELKGKPFLGPAMESNRQTFNERIADAVKRAAADTAL